MKIKNSMLVFIVLIFFLIIGAASTVTAVDVTGDTNTVATVDVMEDGANVDSLAVDDTNQAVGGGDESTPNNAEKTYTDLRKDIEYKSDIKLENDYKYSETLDILDDEPGDNYTNRFTSGVYIVQDCTIDGQGHYIDGANAARIFVIDAGRNVILKNIVFKNGNAPIGSAIYSAGNLTIENCTFLGFNGNPIAISEEQRPMIAVIDSEESYNAQINDPASVLSKYYYIAPREDSIKSDGTPARWGDFVVGHSWTAAYSAPGAAWPWFVITNLGHDYVGNVTVTYDGNVINTRELPQDYRTFQKFGYYLFSIGGANGMSEYKIDSQGNKPIDGQGNPISVDPSKLTFTLTKTDGSSVSYTTADLTPKASLTINRSLSVLAKLIENAAEGTIIELDGDYSYIPEYDSALVNGIVIDKDIRIDGKGYTICGSDAARIFNVSGAELHLNNVTVCHGAAGDGAGVYVGSGALLYADYVVFENNVALDNGGAIYTDGGEIYIHDSVLDSNDVANLETSVYQNMGGAAIYAKNAFIGLFNTNVTNNGRSELDRSKGDMINAVINLINSNGAITGGLFENNTGIYGGAIIADGDGSQTLTVSGATFKNNKAYNGGAIDISSMITDISDCTFDNNWVVGPGSTGYYGLGGAVATDGSGSFSLTDSNFTGNRATGLNASAGAVSVGLDQGCPATIDGCVFKENTAELKAGAVFIAGYDDDATVSNCNFSDDNAAEIGSSLYNGGNLKLTGNTVEGDASGIYSSGAGKIDTHVWVIVNDNQDVTVEYYDTIPIVVKITDDNGNLIRIDEPTMEIDLGDRWTRYTLTLDEATGFYTMDNYLVDQKSGLLTPSRTTIGKYFASYNANTNLNSSYITMIKADASLEVTYQNVSRPDDVVITINLTGKQGAPAINWAATANPPFKVTVNDVEYKVKITNGIGTLTIPDLPAGEYVVNASWGGNTKYKPIEPTTFILKVSNLNVTEFTVNTKGKFLSDENVTINVTLLGVNGEGLNETFNVIVNNAEYTVTVSNGTGSFNVSGLAPGHYSALGIFPGNDNYNGAYATGLFTVLYPLPILNVTVEDITYGEDAVINITLTEADGTPLDGRIGLSVGGIFSLDTTILGFASIKVPNLPANENGWAITVYYLPDEEHINTMNDTEIVKVAKAASTIDLTGPDDINIGENAEFTATIGAKSDVFVLNIWVDGKEYILMGPAEWDSNVASFMITPEWLPEARDYNITVQFKGNENYTASENVSQILTVEKAGSKVTIDPIDNVTFGHTVEISYTVENETTVTYVVVNETGAEQTYQIKDGKLVLSGLSVGNYTVTITNAENNMFTEDSATAKFTVSENPTFDFNVSFPENSTDTVFSISVPKDAGGYLLVDIDGQHYYAPVENGTAVVIVPGLAPGNYNATVSYTGDGKYDNATITKEVTVPSNLPEDALTIPENGDTDTPTTYSISLPADATGYLIVDVDGTKYVAALENGSASVTVPALSEGQHNVTVTYTGDDKYSSASKSTTLNVKKPVYKITNNKNVKAVYSAKAYYKVLVTKDGKAVGAGEKVTIKYNGKTYTVKTDSKGYATLKLNTKVKVKKYTITAEYKGVKVTNKVTIKHVIKAKNKKVKKSKKVTKVKITLKKVNGKVLKAKKLKVKFRGKKYTVKTNKKGVATWKVKKSMLKKLKVGKKYKYKVTYGKDVVTKKLTIKK